MRDHHAIYAHLETRRFGPRMKRCLIRLLNGDSYRAAGRSEGIDEGTLHKAASTVPGLRRAHLRSWSDAWGDDLPSQWRHHLDGLDQDQDVAG